MDYADFIRSKSDLAKGDGFEPIFMPDCLFDFQKYLCDWAIRKGRAAIFADCGLGNRAASAAPACPCHAPSWTLSAEVAPPAI